MYVRSVAIYIEHSAVCLQLVMPVTMGLRLVRLRVYPSVYDSRGNSKAQHTRPVDSDPKESAAIFRNPPVSVESRIATSVMVD